MDSAKKRLQWRLGGAACLLLMLGFAQTALPQDSTPAPDSDDRVRSLEERLAAQQERIDALEARDRDGAPGGKDEPKLLAGYDNNKGFFLRAADDTFELRLGGWIQPRYAFTSTDGGPAEDTSSFSLRRVRLDFQGHAFTRKLRWRIMSEHAATTNLRDAWIDYEFGPALRFQAGQFTVPFQWHRYVSPRRQHFAERGVPSEAFGAYQGRDVGVMLHGMLLERRLNYRAGLFDGAGRNVGTSNSAGNMAAARLTLAVLGGLPREESDLADSQELQFSVGAGALGAWKNNRRAWDLGRSAAGDTRANWLALTADTRLAFMGYSLAVDGYHRSVTPRAADVSTYRGWAYTVSAGAFIIPKQVEAVGRWSQLRLDADDASTRRQEWAIGINLYHEGHDWKTRINYVNDLDGGVRTSTILIEWHLQF